MSGMGLLCREDTRGDASFHQPVEEPSAGYGLLGQGMAGFEVGKDVRSLIRPFALTLTFVVQAKSDIPCHSNALLRQEA